MKIAEMHFELDRRYNKLNSNDKVQLTPMEKDAILNDAILRFVEYNYKGVREKAISTSLELTQHSIDSINSLIVTDTLPYTSSISLDILTNKYLHFVRVILETDCGDFIVSITKHDDLSLTLSDSFKSPSKKWRRAIATFSDNNLNLFIPNNVNVASVKFTYLKYPDKVYYGSYSLPNFIYNGYDSVEFITTGVGYKIGDAPISCNLPEATHSTIIDLAVEQLAKTLYDTAQAQYAQDNINSVL